jgi:type IV pilus assembly protein PilN
VISVNLLPEEERVPEGGIISSPRWTLILGVALAAALVIPLGGLLLMQQVRISSLREDIARAEVEKSRLAPQVKMVQELVARQRELRQRIGVLQSLAKDRTRMVEMVDELARRIPANLWLTRLVTEQPGSFRLEGVTFSNLLVAELMGRLEASDLFYDVDLAESRRDLIGQESVLRFAIVFKAGVSGEALPEPRGVPLTAGGTSR